jgi:hypothetical protein
MIRLLPAFMLPLSACGGPSEDSAAPEDPGTPALVLSATCLDFGEVLLGDDPSALTITMSNRGDATVHIFQVVLEDPDQPFRATDIGTPVLAPGEQTSLELVFEPLSIDEFGTFLEVESDDPHSPSRVILDGVGLGGRLEPSLETVDFGSLPLGCEASLELLLANTGSAAVTIDRITLDGEVDDYTLLVDPAPLTLAPEDQVVVGVDYAPSAEGGDWATLHIASDDPGNPMIELGISGRAEVASWVTDSSEVALRPDFDLIIALDTSTSMSAEIASLEAAFPSFFSTLVELGADFHLAVTRADDGCINGSDVWIDQSFSEAEASATLSTMINLTGSAASNTERAFMLLEAVLAEVGAGGCNEGLVREEAELHLMGISDEAEQSVNSWSHYLSLFRGYDEEVTIHAIGCGDAEGCASAQLYTGMIEAVSSTGGQLLSIEEADWAPGLETLAAVHLASQRTVRLTAKPVEASITVTVDGVTTQGWSYDAEWNAVILNSSAALQGGEQISVHYAEAADCGQGSDA